MDSSTLRRLLCTATLVVCVATQAVFGSRRQDAEPTYTFVTLSVPGAASTDAWDINNQGIVVGHFVADSLTHGFVRTTDGNCYVVDVPGAVFTQATAINDRTEIAGTYRLPNDGVLHAFLRAADGTFVNIDVPGASSSLPRGLNKHGEVAFEAVVGGHTTAYLLSGGFYANIELPVSFAGALVTFSYASGINKHGAIVGRYDTASTGARGFLLDGLSQSGREEGYTTLHFPNASSSAALGIDKKGVIVGGYTMNGVRHGYVLVDDTYTTLDVPECAPAMIAGALTCTTPRKINDRGEIVGFYSIGAGAIRGFLASPE